MRKPRPITDEMKAEIVKAMEAAKTKDEFRRLQACWLRAERGLNPWEIGEIVGMIPESVRRIHARLFKEGAKALLDGPLGGRRRENLTLQEEAELLRSFHFDASQSRMLEVSKVKAAYEELVGHKVPPSTIYRMLARHGWRKVAPWPRHPKADPVAQEEFKKNCPPSLATSLSSRRRKADPSA